MRAQEVPAVFDELERLVARRYRRALRARDRDWARECFFALQDVQDARGHVCNLVGIDVVQNLYNKSDLTKPGEKLIRRRSLREMRV